MRRSLLSFAFAPKPYHGRRHDRSRIPSDVLDVSTTIQCVSEPRGPSGLLGYFLGLCGTLIESQTGLFEQHSAGFLMRASAEPLQKQIILIHLRAPGSGDTLEARYCAHFSLSAMRCRYWGPSTADSLQG